MVEAEFNNLYTHWTTRTRGLIGTVTSDVNIRIIPKKKFLYCYFFVNHQGSIPFLYIY